MGEVVRLVATIGSEEVKARLEEALQRADECDSVVIVMQKKKGGMLWYANSTVERGVYMLESLKLHFFRMTKEE